MEIKFKAQDTRIKKWTMLKKKEPSFCISPELPKNPKTCLTQSLDGLYSSAKSHLMRNLELNTLDYFLWIRADDLGYPYCIWKILGIYNSSLRWLLHLMSKASFDVKSSVQHFESFSVYTFGLLLTCPNAPNTLKQI